MLVGGDLGFSFLVLVVFLAGPVIGGLLVRRKWRLAVARREEVKRLLVFASEESARAELEASVEYVTVGVGPTIPRPLQYQCSVCYSPTTTRCARCKAVRYCSGKCQIIHWRQGHKDECRPFVTTHQIGDVENGSTQKANNQEYYETYGGNFEPEGGQCVESVEKFSAEATFSNSSSFPHVLSEKDVLKIEHPEDGSRVGCSSHSERIDGHHSNNNDPDKLKTTGSRLPSSKNSPLGISKDGYTSLAKLNEIKAECSDGDAHCGSTSSSGWTNDGSNDSSLSEPSTPSSDFWEGTVDSTRSRNDGLDDSSESTSSEAGDGIMSDFQSSPRFPYNLSRNSDVQGSNAKKIILENARPTSNRIKNANDESVSFEEIRKDASKTKNPQLLSSEMSFCKDNNSGSYSHTMKNRHRTSFSSSAYIVHPASGTRATSKNTSNVSSLPSVGIERLNHLANGMSTDAHILDSREMGSLSSNGYLSSSAEKHSVSTEKSGKVDSAGAVAANSPGNGLKTSMRKVVDQFRSSKSSHHSQLGVGSEITVRYSNKGLFSYELFVKLYNCNKAELRPSGLINCGNSCYANAVLQCLAFTPPLTAYLLEGLHAKACGKKGWCFTCEFENLILKVKVGTSPISPLGILSQIQNIGSHLGSGKEEDAHEFLRYAIDTMQSVCLKEAVVKSSGSLEDETTLIGLTFGGYLRSKIKCMKCGGKSERHEKMMDLTVEIEGDIETLEEALKKFTGTEILDGENKYHCSRCKSYERAKKRLTVLEAPNVLTIALKRFQSGKFGKLNKRIRFPEILDLAPCMSGTSDKSPIYRLYGVVVHLDVMNAAFSGHYVCYVKNIQNQWFKIDDSTVEAVEIGRVLTKGAYMLLYARCSPRAPRSVIPRDTRKLKNPSFKFRPHLPDADPSNDQADVKPFYTNHSSFHKNRTAFEEDSSSENSSSTCFSEEGGSSSTDSTRGSSTSADEVFDQIFGDLGHNWNSYGRNSSDSDTSSSSSSSSFPSPLNSRHSPLSELDRYSSGCPETSDSNIDVSGPVPENLGLRARLPSREGNGNVPFLYADSSECRRKLGNSSRCRETDSERLGRANPFDDIKPGGVLLRRSSRERTAA